jgi:hypothetical protein
MVSRKCRDVGVCGDYLLLWQEARGKDPSGRVAVATIAVAYSGFGYLRSYSGHSTCIFLSTLLPALFD